MNLNKFQKFLETINTYYTFALLVYAAILYATNHTDLFYIAVIILTPLLMAWGGYLAHGFISSRNHFFGFRLISDVMTYEIAGRGKYYVRHKTNLVATLNHLMIYPFAHQWSGGGPLKAPKVTKSGQNVLSLIKPDTKTGSFNVEPYRLASSTDGEWLNWFVCINPPVQKDEQVEIDYSHEFYDENKTAKPILYYFVRVPMKRLELSVKFPKNVLPTEIISSYIKSTDSHRIHKKKGVVFDFHKRQATWVIEKPKKGYCYRIEWK